MEYKFSNECEFQDCSVGKIILCKNLDEIILFGNIKIQEGIRSMPVNDTKRYLRDLVTEKGPDNENDKLTCLVGLHSNISHRGRVLGGTQFILKDGLLYLLFDSTTYGPVHPEAVERCIQNHNLKLEHEHLDIVEGIPSLKLYLSKRGK